MTMDIKNSNEKLILALDGMDKSEAFRLIKDLPDLRWGKVGLELFVSAGPEVIFALRDMGVRVFLDLKFHDIPMTMSRACWQVARSGAELITVHACAGIKALTLANQSAVEGAAEAGLPAPTLLAVTVLTSWSSKQFASELVIDQPLEKRVELLADLAFQSGIGGCVCSPLEVKALRKVFAPPFQFITPGIRSAGSSFDDQLRVMSPKEALLAGANRIVVGRPITQSSDPALAFQGICRELDNS